MSFLSKCVKHSYHLDIFFFSFSLTNSAMIGWTIFVNVFVLLSWLLIVCFTLVVFFKDADPSSSLQQADVDVSSAIDWSLHTYKKRFFSQVSNKSYIYIYFSCRSDFLIMIFLYYDTSKISINIIWEKMHKTLKKTSADISLTGYVRFERTMNILPWHCRNMRFLLWIYFWDR